jgi:SAM-dependent methyltransferase
MSRDQAILFDQLAAGDTLYEYAPEALERLRDLVPDKGRMLDVGCGDGVIGRALRGKPGIGVDISPRCVKLAQQRGLHAAVADATTAFPLQSGAFDTVYCVDVLHHLGQAWDPIFAELDRVLRPGGTLVVVEPDARNPLVKWTQAPDSPIRVAPYDNEPAINPAELLPQLNSRGYRVDCSPIHIEGSQVERSVFPLWQRLLKAPFVIALAFYYRKLPNKFAIVARKPE